MMPRPPGSVDPYKWTLDLPPGPLCSVGWSTNALVSSDGTTSSSGRPDEDRYYTCNFQDKLQLYMVLDGHDGSRACEFVQKHLPNVLLRCELDGGGEAVKEALMVAFRNTEREFFIRIDPHITRKITLQIEMSQKARNSAEALRLYPDQVEEIQRLESQIKGGTTVAVAAIFNQHLYVANVGDSRALLCSQSPDGQLHATQLSIDHNTSNDEELRRLAECGLDPNNLRRTKRLGTQQNTRSIGDYSIKGGYKDIDIISHARMEPGTAEPYVCSPVDLTNFQGFLVLMSDGLYEAYEAWTKRPSMVNQDIAHLVAKEMKQTSDISVVAQNVVEKVKYLFVKTCAKDQRSGRLDDITLIVRNIRYPMAISHAVSHPSHFSSDQPPLHPPTVMPSLSFQPGYTQSTSYPPQSYVASSGQGLNTAPSTLPQYPSNAQDLRVHPAAASGGSSDLTGGGGGGGGLYYGGHTSLQYPQTDQYGRPIQPGTVGGAYYSQGYSGGASVYTSSGYSTTVPTGAVYSTSGFGVPPPSQQPPPSHAPLHPTKSEPVFRNITPDRSHRPSLPTEQYLNQQQGSDAHHRSPQHGVSITTTPVHQTPPTNTPRSTTTHHYENAPDPAPLSTSPRANLQVDPNNSSQYVNVSPAKQGLDPSRHEQHLRRPLSDSALSQKAGEDQSLRGTNASQEYPSPVMEKTEVKLSTQLSQTPPSAIRPKSAESRETPAGQNPNGSVATQPAIIELRKQKSVEKKTSKEELFEMYGWDANGSEQTPSQPSTLTQSSSQPGTMQSSGLGSFFGRDEEQQEDKKEDEVTATPPTPRGEHKTQEVVKPKQEEESGSDDEEGLFTADMSDFSEGSGAEEEEVDSHGCIKPYVRNWDTVPKDLSWDNIPVEV